MRRGNGGSICMRRNLRRARILHWQRSLHPPSFGRRGLWKRIRKPRVAIACLARELILPCVHFGNGSDATRGEQVDDVAGADLRGPKVDGVLAAISKVAIALATLRWNDDRRQAAEAVKMCEGGRLTHQGEVWRDVAMRRARQAIMYPCCRLQSERMKSRW